MLFHHLTFSLYVSLGLKWVSCKQHIYRCCFCIHSAILCLLVGAFNPFTFKVIIDMYVPIAIFLIFLVCSCRSFFFLYSLFLFSFGLMTIFSVLFGLCFLFCVCIYYSFWVCCSHEVLLLPSIYVRGYFKLLVAFLPREVTLAFVGKLAWGC